jgi:iron complex transport system substrate-binding protein
MKKLFAKFRLPDPASAAPCLIGILKSVNAWRVKTYQIMACLVLAGMADGAHAYEVTDDRGVTVSFTQPPQRVVSLLPSLAETVCELGACERLVGVDRYSNYPASLQKLPQVGGGLDPNIEAIVALRPDVVLMAVSSRASDHLRGLGLKVVALEPKTHADVQRVMLTIGTLLGVPDAAKIWRAIDAGVSAAAQSIPPGIKATRVYFEVNQGPYAAGESSFIGETLTRLGVKNIVPAKFGPFPKLNPEFTWPQIVFEICRAPWGPGRRVRCWGWRGPWRRGCFATRWPTRTCSAAPRVPRWAWRWRWRHWAARAACWAAA